MTAAVRHLALALTLTLCLPGAGAPQAPPSNVRMLGRWRGTSVCVKAPWNAACHDEQVSYHIARAAHDGSRIAVHAEKRVGTASVPMGDLELGFDKATSSWVTTVTTARAQVLWSYRLEQGRLIGRLVELPSGRRLRNVAAVRDSA